MTCRRSNSWSNKKTVRNLQYLENLERKKKMAGQIVDGMGIPVGGNSRPQAVQINPMLQMFWPLFCQTIHDVIAVKPDDRPTILIDGGAGIPESPAEIVDAAFQIADLAMQKVIPRPPAPESKPEPEPETAD